MLSTYRLSRCTVLQLLGLMVGVAQALAIVASSAMANPAITLKDTAYAIPASGVYFVSPAGNDANAGTAVTTPLRTLQKAVQVAPSGSTIVLRAGTYRESIPSLTKQITFQPYPHEQVWLKGSVIVTGFVQNGSIWRKDNWTYKFIPTADTAAIDPAYPMAQYPDQAFIDGNSLTQVASKAQVGAGTFYVDYTLNQLFIGDNPAGRTVEGSAYVFAINMQTGSDYSVVRGLGIQQYAPHFEGDQPGMVLGNANHLTFENNTFAYSASRGLTIFGTDVVIRGNTFIYNSESGLGGYAADRTVVDNNYIAYNNTEHFDVSYDAGGAKFAGTDSMVWTNNLFEFNIGAGAWCDWASHDTQFLNNIFRYNAQDAIKYEKSGYAIMAGNLIYGNSGAGIKLNGANNNKIYNNTFSRNTSHLSIVDDARRTGDATAPGITEYNVINNNILSNGDGASPSFLYEKDYANQDTGDVMVSQLDYNAYYRTSAAIPSHLIGWEVAGTIVYYNTLATFQAARNRELHGLSIDNQATNPFFVNEAGEDYHLLSKSPAKGRGQPLPTDVAAALGVTAGVPVDMGAYPIPAPTVDTTPIPAPTVDTSRPSTPTGLTATVISPAQITLAWTASTDNVGVAGYRVFRNGIQIDTPVTHVYSDTGLQAGTSYAYTVAAYDAAGNTSASSTRVSATTPSVNTVVTITAPTTGQTVRGTITIRATVSANVTGVNFYVDGVYVGNGGASDGLVTASWTTTTLANGNHTIVAKAFAPGATATNTLSVNVFNGADTTRPSTPTGLTATVISPAQITLAWTASTDNVGVAGYQVFRNGIQIGTPVTPVYFDTGLQAGTSYAYTVAAYDAAGNTSASSTRVSATTPSVNTVVTITAPTTGQTVRGTITIRATVSTNVTGVNFYVDGVYVGNGGASGGLVTASWTTTTVANGNHTIVAKAFAAGATATNTLSVNVFNGADTTRPSTPTGLTATVISPAQITLAWTASTDNVGVAGYQVFRNGIQIGTPVTHVYSDTGLQAGTSYAYTVAAYDAAGNTSASSTRVSATTPSVNTVVTITAPTTGQTVRGTITIRATVSTNVTGVNFYVDGVYVGNGGASGGLVTASWTTTTVANGNHTIVAKAFAAGATATNTLSVNVSN